MKVGLTASRNRLTVFTIKCHRMIKSSPSLSVEHSERVTRIFGYWPSFHDAEVMDVHLWRGNVDPESARSVFPVLTVKLHLWELTNETDLRGFLVLRHHTIATLRFHDVEDNIQLTGFNQQNVIFELTIERRQRSDGPSPFLVVEFISSFGMGAIFHCRRAEVLDAVPCDENGKQTGPAQPRSS